MNRERGVKMKKERKKYNLKFIFIILVLLFSMPVTIYATEESKTEYRYRDKKTSQPFTPKYSYPWILDRVEAKAMLVASGSNASSGAINRWKTTYPTEYFTYNTTCTGKAYVYSSKTGTSYTSEYQLSPTVDDNGKTAYYMAGVGYVYYSGYMSVYDYKIYSKNVYHYYQWSEWSDWSESVPNTKTNREIESRVLYKKKITYQVNGGTEIENDSVFQGEKIIRPENPTRKGCVFGGWYIDKDFTEIWDFDNDTISEDVVLYAKWNYTDAFWLTTDNKITWRNNDIVISPKFIKGSTNKALVAKYKFDSTLLKYDSITFNDYKYGSAKVTELDSQYSILTVTAQYNTSGYLQSSEVVNPYSIKFLVTDNATYGNTSIEIYDSGDVYMLNDVSEKVYFDATDDVEISIERSLVNEMKIIGSDKINCVHKYTVEISPDDALGAVTWSVDNENVAKITEDGVLKPKSNGIVNIIATALDGSGMIATKSITVEDLISYLDNIEFSDNCHNVEYDCNTYEYNVGIDEDSSSVSIAPYFGDGLLMCGDELLFSGFEKEIPIDNKKTSVIFTFTMSNAQESTYIINFYKVIDSFDIAKSESKYDVSIYSETIEDDGVLIATAYNGNDLVDVYTSDVDVKYGINRYTVNIGDFDNVEFDSVKFMLWNDFQTMTPLVNGCVVEGK